MRATARLDQPAWSIASLVGIDSGAAQLTMLGDVIAPGARDAIAREVGTVAPR